MTTLQIFVSSPGDVGEERLLAQRVIERAQGEFVGRMLLQPIFWEQEPLRATASFQEQIPRPSATDIAIFILWARLGTRLPAHLTRPDGSRYASGTEFEFEDAVWGYRQQGQPDVLVYRKTAVPMIPLGPEARERVVQKEALDAFITAWFQNPEGALTAAFHPFHNPAQFEELLETHLHKLLSARLPILPEGPERVAMSPLWTQGSPFRGLEVFEREHALVFCGRTQAISEVLGALRQQAADGRAFVLLSGRSGVGKSSLVRAGVLPSLTEPGVIDGIGVWRQALLRPSDTTGDLRDGVAAAILRAEALPELAAAGITPMELAGLLRETPQAAVPLLKAGLAQAAAEVQRREQLDQPPVARLVLVVDQLEEIFSLERVTPAERTGFVAMLGALARSGQVWVLATLRSDFYPRCGELPELLALKEGAGQYELRPPTPAELSQMIRQPARLAGLRFEAEADTAAPLDDVLRDTTLQAPEALPLLEFTLDALYEHRTAEGLLTHAAYTALGGLEGALARRAEAVFADLPAAVRAALPAVLSALISVGLGDHGSVTRRRAPLDAPLTTRERRALIEALVAARLFVADRADDGTSVVSVVHEALWHHWPHVQTWLSANREFLRARARIATAAALWQEAGQTADLLLPAGRHLQEAADLLATRRAELSGGLITYIVTSIEKRRRKRRRAWMAGAVVMLMFSGAGLGYWDAYHRAHVEHYANVITRKGLPEGIGRLTDAQVRHRNTTLTFNRRGRRGPVHEIRLVNGRGVSPPVFARSAILSWGDLNPLEYENMNYISEKLATCRVTFECDTRGRILNQRAYNCADRELYTLHYPVPNMAEYKEGAFESVVSESGITHIMFDWPESGPEEGFARKLLFFGNRKLQPDRDGTYGYQQVFDPRGRVVEKIMLGADHQPTVDRVGVAKQVFTYDALGNITRITTLGHNRQPVLNTSGVAEEQIAYDQHGNVKEIAFLGTEGQLATLESLGAAGRAFRYDAHGNLVEGTFFGPNRQLVSGRPGSAEWLPRVAKQTIVWETPERSLETYFGPDGKPILLFGSVAKQRAIWDARGYPVEKASFDEHDHPTRDGDGCAKVRMTHDVQGNLSEWACLDETDHPVRSTKGFAKAKLNYDERGNAIEAIYFGPTGQRELYEQPYVTVQSQYNSQGKLVETVYFDAAGHPVKTKEGYAKITNKYNLQGQLIEVSFFDAQNRPTPRTGGYAQIRRTYDARGKLTEEIFFDPQGKPVRHDDGYVKATFAYDQRGYRVEVAYFDNMTIPPCM